MTSVLSPPRQTKLRAKEKQSLRSRSALKVIPAAPIWEGQGCTALLFLQFNKYTSALAEQGSEETTKTNNKLHLGEEKEGNWLQLGNCQHKMHPAAHPLHPGMARAQGSPAAILINIKPQGTAQSNRTHSSATTKHRDRRSAASWWHWLPEHSQD